MKGTVSVPETHSDADGPLIRDVVDSPARRATYVESGHWNGTTLIERILDHAARQPDAIAVVDRAGSRRITYGRLGVDVTALLQEMVSRGLHPGDVVSIQLPNCYEAVVVAAATQAIGGVINPLLPSYRAHEIGHVYATARPRLHVFGARSGDTDLAAVATEASTASGHRPMHVTVDLDTTPDDGGWLHGTSAGVAGEHTAIELDPAPWPSACPN